MQGANQAGLGAMRAFRLGAAGAPSHAQPAFSLPCPRALGHHSSAPLDRRNHLETAMRSAGLGAAEAPGQRERTRRRALARARAPPHRRRPQPPRGARQPPCSRTHHPLTRAPLPTRTYTTRTIPNQQCYIEENTQFQLKVVSKSGLDVDGTYLPAAIHPSLADQPKTDMKTAMLEAEMVMGGAVADLLEKTGIKPEQIGARPLPPSPASSLASPLPLPCASRAALRRAAPSRPCLDSPASPDCPAACLPLA